MRLSVFETNMLQGGYLDVNRGSANGPGKNSIMGRFVLSKALNSVRIMEKITRYDDGTDRNGRGRYKELGRKYPKENLHSEHIFSDRRTQTQYTVEKWR